MEHLELTLLTSAFVIPFILSITILVGSKENFPKLVMSLALFNAFYVFLANYFYFQKLFEYYTYLHSLHIATVLWIFPSIYLYIKSIISTKKEFKKELLHLLPGLVFGITSATIFYGFLTLDERIQYLSTYRSGVEFTTLNLKILTLFRSTDVLLIVAQVIYYSITFFRLPKKYNERLNHEYSNIDQFSINWLKWFNGSFVLVGLMCVLFYMFNPFEEENELFLVGFLFVISAFTWILGIWSFKQQKPEITKTENSELVFPIINQSATVNTELTRSLISYFEEKEPFLNPNLNLTTVCKEVGTNRTYLSNIINHNFGMNFNVFVNQYRVKHVQNYLKDNPDTSLENLVQIGGFGSVSSLKRAMANQNQE
ncbi:helix-turn-helix domain-containing protein [Sunxiuqinia sp. A32]|uniref:helix-turn-helix domain-containing protein n=1 Tax=Sunxiuqinia sp. A32 TaxID=3461496 RepID=UPI0040453CBA